MLITQDVGGVTVPRVFYSVKYLLDAYMGGKRNSDLGTQMAGRRVGMEGRGQAGRAKER